MEILKVTDSVENALSIVYMYGGLSEALTCASRKFSAYNSGGRAVLEVTVVDDYSDIVRAELEDKIADVIAINYKCSFFFERVRPLGLTEVERNVLLSALISADVEDDKWYIKRKICSDGEYSVDGLFNFRLAPLRKKWQEVCSYIPRTFDAEKLKDFIGFLLEEKSKNRVFAENNRVFDKHFRRLNRTFLTGIRYGEEKLLCEILLSGAGEAELLSPVSINEEELLKEYLGDKIIFGKTYFCEQNN